MSFIESTGGSNQAAAAAAAAANPVEAMLSQLKPDYFAACLCIVMNYFFFLNFVLTET